MHNIKLSIIIPCYNTEIKTLKRCLDSLSFLPDITPCEIIVVDDGSTKKDIIGYLKERNESHIRAIRQENMGCGGARNTGIENSSGEYIAFVDSDDYVQYGPFVQILNILEEKQPDILCQGTKECYEGSATKYMMEHDIIPSSWSYFIKRKTLGSLRYTPNIYHEDEEFSTKLHLLRAHLITLNYTSYVYCYEYDSIINSKSDEKIIKRYADLIKILSGLKSLNVPAPHKAALLRRLHIIAMCYVVTLMRDTSSLSITRNCLKDLKEIGLYPLPLRWHGLRYLCITLATYFPLLVYTLTPIVKLLFKLDTWNSPRRNGRCTC